MAYTSGIVIANEHSQFHSCYIIKYRPNIFIISHTAIYIGHAALTGG